jgi:phosphonate transport system substrate-binding protein
MKSTLRAVTYLAPNQLALHQFVVQSLGEKLGCEVELVEGVNYEDVYNYDLSFICGLPYVLRSSSGRIEPLAAPVLQGTRYQNKPIYFSDVIVHKESSAQSFAELRGCTWAYNEPESQSGYGITRYCLVKYGLIRGFFSRVIKATYHQEAIRLVAEGKIDAAAIDSHVLALEIRDYPELAAQVRVIDSLGPSTIQPIAIAAALPKNLKHNIRLVLTEIHLKPTAKARLAQDFVERFVSVSDNDYDDIRHMLAECENANFMTLK